MKMKNVIRFAAILAALSMMFACAPAENTGDDTTAANDTTIAEETTAASDETTAAEEPKVQLSLENGKFTEDDMYFSGNGVTFKPGIKMSEIIDQLGEPDSFSEAPSCYAEGLDKIYEYAGFTVYTNPDGDDDIITDIELGEGAATPKGAKVGDDTDTIIGYYGDNYSEEGINYVYSIENTDYSLSFTIIDGKVDAIEYICQ